MVGFVWVGMLAANPCSVFADLIFQIDAENDVAFLTGSVNGSPGTGGIVAWSNDTKANGFVDFIDLLPAISSSDSHVQGAILAQTTSGFTLLAVALTNAQPTTLSADGTAFSYANWNPANRMKFESLLQESVPLSFGNDYAAVQVTSIAEPNAIALMGIVVMLIVAYWLRRQ